MNPAVGLLALAGTSIQFGAAYAVTLFDRLGPGGAVWLRLAFAAGLLMAFWHPRLRGRPREDLRLAVVFGVVLGFMNWSFYEALHRIPLGPTVAIELAGPLAVGILGSRRPLDFVWALLAATGIVLLVDPFGAGALDPAGVALALIAACCWAVYILLSARTGRVWPGASGLAVACVVAAALTLPAGVVQGGAELLRPELLAAGAFVGLMSSVIPYTLEMEALRRLRAGAFGILMSLEPALAALAGFLVLGQGLAAVDILAIGLVGLACAGTAVDAAPAPSLDHP